MSVAGGVQPPYDWVRHDGRFSYRGVRFRPKGWRFAFQLRRCRWLSAFLSALCLVLYALGFGTENRVAHHPPSTVSSEELLVMTVASHETSALKRFRHSVVRSGLQLHIVGLGETWRDLCHAKVTLLGRALHAHRHDVDKIVLFADAYDVLFNGDAATLLAKFRRFRTRILFSAETACEPIRFQPQYPPASGYRYLNSGLFMGYAPDLYRLVSHSTCPPNVTNDQVHYAQMYLDQRLRFGIQLDHKAQLFQSMHLASGHVQLGFQGRRPLLRNALHDTNPLAVHFNSYLMKHCVAALANYFPDAWNPVDGCVRCTDDTVDLERVQVDDYPTVVLGVFIDRPTAFLDEFLRKLTALSYPKKKLHLFIHDLVRDHGESVAAALRFDGQRDDYASVRLCRPPPNIDAEAKSIFCKEMAIDECVERNCDHYLYVEAAAHLDNADALRLLIEQNRSVVAPLLYDRRHHQWNFATFDSYNGQPDRCYPPTADFVQNKHRGLWLVNLITSCYLIRGDVIRNNKAKPSYQLDRRSPVSSGLINTDTSVDDQLDWSLSLNLHYHDIDLFISNRFDFGTLEMNSLRRQ